MKKIEIVNKIRNVMAELIPSLSMEEVQDNDSLQEQHGVDSIVLMEFMVLLEEEFDIQFDEDFDLTILDTIGGVSDYIATLVVSGV